MDKEKYVQQIASDLFTLPEDKVIEVADFVHFLIEQVEHQGAPLHMVGLIRKQAFDLRAGLSTFENDWNAPGMEAYDDL